LTITADIFKEGHDELAAVVRWRQMTPRETEPREEQMRFLGNDAWEANLPLTGNGLYAFTVEAWPDSFGTWVHELERKVEVGRDVSSELLEGATLLDAAAARVKAGGGRILEGPREVAGGRWIVRGTDPQGAMFGLEGKRRKAVGYFESAPNPSGARGRRWHW